MIILNRDRSTPTTPSEVYSQERPPKVWTKTLKFEDEEKAKRKEASGARLKDNEELISVESSL